MNRRTFIELSGLGVIALSLGTDSHGAENNAKKPARLPGMTRQAGSIFLTENHCNSLIAWHSMGITNATVVHIDTHDDFRAVSQEKLDALTPLLDKRNYREVFLNSDTSQFLNMKKRNADLLYDLGNFLYPCMRLGIVSRVYWVVPDREITDEQSMRLQAMTRHNLPVKSIAALDSKRGGFTADIDGLELIVLTLDDLPDLGAGTLHDVDVDFFTFAKAMTDEHLIGEVSRDPEECLAILNRKAPHPKAITISASVWGGYTPLLQRFLADGIFEFYAKKAYPSEARTLMRSVADFKAGNTARLASSEDMSKSFLPAWRHQQALRHLSVGNIESAKKEIVLAAAENNVYMKGLLDMAEALLAMKTPAHSHDFINRFEALNSGLSYNSLSIRAMSFIEQGNPKEALSATTKLEAWSRNPYTLLLHGSALKAAGRLDEARTCFTTVLESKPQSAAAQFNLGLIAEAKGETSKAIRRYREAIASRSNFWQAYEHLGHIMLMQKKYTSATNLLARAIEINPFAVTSINNLGLSYARQNRPDKAIPLYRRALRFSPDNAAIRLNLAESLTVTGKKKEAAELCRAILTQGEHGAARKLLERITGK